MEYRHFSEIGLPVGTVTESNPAHRLAFWRFSSEQIKSFNKLQADIIRSLAPGRDLVHNFMGNFVEFDHFDVSHPDSSAFHHDLYRACGKGRMWLMEQQPGPVNWAPFNPSPLPGMVRLWGWEAFAHGAELVSYFRWRQVPYGQEQMHSALLLPDGREDDAAIEVKRLSEEISKVGGIDLNMQPAQVALLFDYAGDQAARIQQPDGQNYDPLVFIQSVYSAFRQLGVRVDIVPTTANLANYKLIVLANCCVSDQNLANKLGDAHAHIIMFPRTGSKTSECSIPEQLPPGAFQPLIDIKVTRVETLPKSISMITTNQSVVVDWRERVEANFPAEDKFADGWGFHFRKDRVHYINGCPELGSLLKLIKSILNECGVAYVKLNDGLRIMQRGDLTLAFNYGPRPVELSNDILCHFGSKKGARILIGHPNLAVGELCAWTAA